ncbi:hypothetical protein HYDPIDRAFT_33775 [Hydnomerulius pinastri MD-312]|uniref:Uncharacterized protein n=1 Tax=Hydnomerulius pinastri MD-312 TaxID=994086 RepID=A0A0C9W7H5_9AGAM|nr:hypothetical protein HYDPIDRAFT_33775 [Hydnomerulius pinastri MD-312]
MQSSPRKRIRFDQPLRPDLKATATEAPKSVGAQDLSVHAQSSASIHPANTDQQFYIKVVHHPHAGLPLDIIPLQSNNLHSSTSLQAISQTQTYQSLAPDRCWAPFATLQDFEFTETAVQGAMRKGTIDSLLRGIQSSWASGTSITLKNHHDVDEVLRVARMYYVQGVSYEFKFPYRDPWEIYCQWITDPTLAPFIFWHPVQKFIHCGGSEQQIFDESYTAMRWWDIQSSLPETKQDGIPHCFLPSILWLDKGMITKRVRKHPILLRAAFVPREIRNGSGNGGGVLVGYMPVIRDLSDPSSRNTAETLAWACFKREVYHKVLQVIFGSLRHRARSGEAIKCGDDLNRVIYPGIPIESLDGEESCKTTATRAALADHPCPKCLVRHEQLHNIDETFTQRTTQSMMAVYQKAACASTKSEAESILQSHGLHGTQNFFWTFRHSDPYLAASYDALHSDDLGKWGRHLWVLTLQELERLKAKGQLACHMRHVSRWPNLKHFNDVTTVEYTDGDAHLDILRCILPCIVQLLPVNSELVHCIRAYSQYRMMIDLPCLTTDRFARLENYITTYKKCCQRVSRVLGKNFNFYKQHAINHVIEDIKQKGALNNYSTRPGEGFHQEVQEAYEQTNCKNTDPQMARIDENQEAVAHIRMLIDNEERRQAELHVPEPTEDGDTNLEEPASVTPGPPVHWKLGSPLKLSTSHDLLDDQRAALRLHGLLKKCLQDAGEDLENNDGPIKIRPFKCLYLTYQSQVDWKEGRDILRCNPVFHGEPRYDCVLVNTELGDLSPARLRGLYRCSLSSAATFDVALVNTFRPSSWQPKTKWCGAKVFEQSSVDAFIPIKYLIRGVHMIKAFGTKEGRFFLNDLVDGDIFLRAGN